MNNLINKDTYYYKNYKYSEEFRLKRNAYYHKNKDKWKTPDNIQEYRRKYYLANKKPSVKKRKVFNKNEEKIKIVKKQTKLVYLKTIISFN